jgi:hypothetical protein
LDEDFGCSFATHTEKNKNITTATAQQWLHQIQMMTLSAPFSSSQQERVREGFLKCFLPDGNFECLLKDVLFKIFLK